MCLMRSLISSWPWKMAWRESRSHRRRLVLFVLSIALGVAALVAIASFGQNLEQAINEQAKALLGADLLITSRQPLTPDVDAWLRSLGGEQSRETSFASMVSLPKNGRTRLVQVRALEGRFPFYGQLQTAPPSAAHSFQDGPQALVEDGLMLQLDAQLGDEIKIGAFTYRIAGRLLKVPGEVSLDLTGPRVYIPMAYLNQTKLLQRGSLASYRAYFKFDQNTNVEQVVARAQPQLTAYRLSSETAQQRQMALGRAMENVYGFLNLVGFIALLLGSIGVASAIHVYIKQKIATVAILRCIGAKTKQTVTIYVIQATLMGLIGATAGALLGTGVQRVLPRVFSDFLPVSVPVTICWRAIAEGMATGLGITLLFVLLPLLSVRRISPLRTLRVSYEETHSATNDRLRWVIYALIALAVSGFAVAQTGRWTVGIGFAAGLGVAFGVLAGVGALLMKLVRAYFPTGWTYVWRQGLANLYRPNNQTVVLILALGLGTFLISTLYLTQHTLLSQVAGVGGGNNPNLVLFDIQNDQKERVANLVRSFDLPLLQQVPVVTMRLVSVGGRSVAELLKDPTRSDWPLQREYRVTYRERLIDTEQVVAGRWQGRAVDPGKPIPISLEEGIARPLRVSVGDELVFDVQGVPIRTVVGSIREVQWRRIQPNFLVVFPAGVLEDAPQFHVFVTRASSSEASAAVQRAVVKQFPNVSMIDLTLVLDTVDSVLTKVSFVIQFMALFSIITGLIVLASTVVSSRYQRMQESVLLRTLGASRAQIIHIMMVEYLCLGTAAALTGLLLSLASSWALARFVFETPLKLALVPVASVCVLVIGLTILIGMLNSRGTYNRPPLEVLRVDV
ncbi:MAG: FtsX-like permease family protein [Acidobacteriota bacterium]|nr:ABC transporter permease [Blastocatellia bacterium]MDW8240664.1 FtsX-like permease family protein [Acidobacteriota bacterium]